MILRKLALKLILAYRYISPLFGSKCRYYPTCSTYAMWEFENDNFFRAFFKTTLRILRCNQLFRGGIDYPVIFKSFTPIYGKKTDIKYWYIPQNKNKYIVIKADNGKQR